MPAEPRDAARMLVLGGRGGLEDAFVRDLPRLLDPGDLLVVNDTRVRNARIFGRRATGGKVELLLQLIRGETKLVDACREHDLKQSEVESWMETFLKSGERGLKANAEDEVAVREREIKELRAKIGELVLELDARKKWAALNCSASSRTRT